MATKNLFWVAFAVFVALALALNRHDGLFSLGGPLAAGKVVLWCAFIGFTGYSAYCSTRENLFRTIAKIAELHWGRQIGIDLYLGLSLTLFIVYLNEGSVLVTLLWLAPTLAFANLATLLYFAIHYDSIVARFLG